MTNLHELYPETDNELAAHGGGVGERGVRLPRGILPPPHGPRRGAGDGAPPLSPVAVCRADQLTRLQLDEIGRERQVQRQGAQRAEARAELSVELAQARILPAYELGR